MRFSVRVPASSANLGSGFDTLAVALGLFTTVDVEATDGDAVFEGGPDLAGGENLIAHGMHLAAEATGRELPPSKVRVSSEIPVARGLGSSATALIAGLLAGNHLLGSPLSRQEIFELATGVEGHGDNVSASLFGGVTLSLICPDRVIYRQIPLGGALRVALFVPDAFGLTADARAVVPTSIPRQDAVANIGRCALLILSLMQGDFAMLHEAMQDMLHQPYRNALFPHTAPMIEAATAHGAYGACLSGAGPSVLAFVAPERAEDVVAVLNDAAQRCNVAGAAVLFDIVTDGATITDAV
ncbi:MAG TPA: homoserine kinase [Nitrolancea sp.]|nr:homoserine kinase [Nitrolancea sp.]